MICINIDEIPQELASLAKLEQILVSKRIVFQKIIVMPKGQQRKIKGAICNIPVECDQTCNHLTRAPESSGIVRLKLTTKLKLRGHVYFQGVRPQLLQEALCWLKDNNPLNQDIVIDFTNFDENLTTLHDGDVDQETTNSIHCTSFTPAYKCQRPMLRSIRTNIGSSHRKSV